MGHAETDWRARIVIDPTIHHGKPCIRGTRVPVSIIVESVAYGDTHQQIIDVWPQLSGNDIKAALKFAAEVVGSGSVQGDLVDDRLMWKNSRNRVLGFAERTRKNLQYVERSRSFGANVHVITQLTLSLLGLVVFPCADEVFVKAARSRTLDALENKGWPKWKITEFPENIDTKRRETRLPTNTLDRLLARLRNAIAHRHVEFSSEGRRYEEVAMTFKDQIGERKLPYWVGSI